LLVRKTQILNYKPNFCDQPQTVLRSITEFKQLIKAANVHQSLQITEQKSKFHSKTISES